MENLGLSVVNVFTVDWVTASFSQSDVYSVISMLGLEQDAFTYSEKYSWGYPCTAEYGHIRIYYNPYDIGEFRRFPKANSGCALNLSGQACRELETFCPTLSWAMLFSRLELLGAKFTRLDLAYDDRTGVISLPRLAVDIADDNFIGRARYTQRIYSHDYDSDIDGLTVYVGSKNSDVFVRIYDKAAERGFSPADLHWVRVEIQLRADRAVMAARSVATEPHIGDVFAGILANYLKILEPTADSNKSRWPVADYWKKVIRDVSALHLTMPGIEYNFRKSEVHFLTQYKQFLYAYLQIYGAGAPDQLFRDILRMCEGDEIKQKYLIAIREAHLLYGAPSIPADLRERQENIEKVLRDLDWLDFEQCTLDDITISEIFGGTS